MVLLAALPILAVMLFALGSATLAKKQSEAHTSFLQGFLNFITGKTYVHQLAQAIANKLGQAYASVDAEVGASLSGMAVLVGRIATTFGLGAKVVYTIAELATGNASWVDVRKALNALSADVTKVGKVATKEIAQVRATARTAEHAVTDVALPRLGRLERDVTDVIPREIANVRDLARGAENEAIRAFKWAKSHATVVTSGVVAGVLTYALSLVGLGGLNCSNLKNMLNNRGCGLWQGLEDLLGLFVDVLVLADLCKILPDAVTAFGYVEAPLTGVISQAANAVCAVGNPDWTNPDVPAGPRPPVQAFEPASLASGG